jgi:hypothetical protein
MHELLVRDIMRGSNRLLHQSMAVELVNSEMEN